MKKNLYRGFAAVKRSMKTNPVRTLIYLKNLIKADETKTMHAEY